MKRIPILMLLTVMVTSFFVVGCRDEEDPQYNIDMLYDRPWREKALKNIQDIFSKAMQENGNDLTNAKVKEVTDVFVPGLIKAFNDFDRDPANRKIIVELLAQMRDPRAVDVFVKGLTLENTSDSAMFTVAANAVQRQKTPKALPALLAAWNKVKSARDTRQGAPFTSSENEIVQSFISAAAAIIVEQPSASEKGQVVDALIIITDTPDTLQELRLNMKAMKALGRIGDDKAVPVLIRGIAQKGIRQPIGLGTIAFAALQQIHNRDSVVKAILAFAKGEDKAFNKAYEKELQMDPVMKNPLWFIQQANTFLGELNYASPSAVDFLTSEFNHIEPDDLDKKAMSLQLQVQMENAEGWAQMRRNWAAVALAELGQTQIMDELVNRIKFKGGKVDIPLEEAVGYFRAMGLLNVPQKACPVMLKALGGADDSLRDKLFYNASLMCGDDFFKPMDKAIKKIDCDKIVKERLQGEGSPDEEKQVRNECEVMKKRIEGYKDRIKFGEECGEKVDCYLKVIADHTNKNVERAIVSVHRIARDNKGVRDKVVDALIANLNNPSKVALSSAIRALDELTPQGGDKLEGKIKEVYAEFARQSTYKDRARMLEAFIGHVRNRGRK
ncbi:MAG: HEAT repeat domain-containing protein [Deltaproteobacteria bacterium]|nr:HEAT repeat domain-containing protein [Deltaproteobacteria bacterium]